MSSLFVLTNEYRSAAEKLADLELPPEVIADTLESLSGELEEKAQNVGHMVRRFETDAAACKAWAKAASDRAKAIEARAEAMRGYLASAMQACGIEKIEGPGIRLSFRKSSAVVIDELGLIPAEFMVTPEPPPAAPSKTLIGNAIKAGQEVPGAHIEQRRNLQIA